MKTYLIKYSCFVWLIALAFSWQSCDKDFESVNVNPDTSPVIEPEFVFTKAQYDGVAEMPPLLLGTMQYTTSYNDVAGFGSKYITSQVTQTYATFSNAYPKELNEIALVINALRGDTANVNQLCEARIWKVYCYSRLTDLYGDIPYSEASLGYDSALYQPGYDKQQTIYMSMLSELESSINNFDGSATFGSADLMYGGDVTKWKKFGYSLMLRLAMRMTKVDAAAAQSWAAKAIAGGVILNDDDVAAVKYVGSGQDINKNPLALNLWNSDYIAKNGSTNVEGGKYQDTFISYLKDNNDPRLPILSVVWVNGAIDTSSSIQIGMADDINNVRPTDFVKYSEPNPNSLLLLNSPRILYDNAESYFLLAEAALRGWYTGGSPAELYASGIRAAMHQWAIVAGSYGTISESLIDSYIAAHAFNTGGTFDQQMEQIYTQFWVGIFPDAQEVYSTYRRTGYPNLTPNNYAGNATGGKIFRRFLYPLSEQNLNTASYNAAIADQGADDLMTRIWWDVQ